MAAPTLADYRESDWTDLSTSGPVENEVSASATWLAGDVIVVLGATEDNGRTLATPTATGLTFSLITSTNTGSNCKAYLWTATAGSNGSGAITSVLSNALTAAGISVFVFRGCSGVGTPQTIIGSAAKTISVTRAQANSLVVCLLADWNATADVAVTATPTGTVRVATNPTNASFYVTSFGDQGTTGTTSYGIANHTGTVKMAGIALEVKGSTSSHVTTTWQSSYKVVDHSTKTWQSSYAVKHHVTSTWQSSYKVTDHATATWQSSYKVVDHATTTWQSSYAVKHHATTTWQSSYATKHKVTSTWQSSYVVRHKITSTWASSYAVRHKITATWQSSYAITGHVTATWTSGYKVTDHATTTWQSSYVVRDHVTASWASSYMVQVTGSDHVLATWASSYKVAHRTTRTWQSGYVVSAHVTRTWISGYGVQHHVTAAWQSSYHVVVGGHAVRTWRSGFTVYSGFIRTGTLAVVAREPHVDMTVRTATVAVVAREPEIEVTA
jgi:hypothetical protein